METAIKSIVDESQQIGNAKDALEFVKNAMDTRMMPILRTMQEEANEYRVKRDGQNVKLNQIKNNVIVELIELFVDIPYITIKLMSSIGVRLNLMKESDIDFGLLVNGLNTHGILPDMNILCEIRDRLLQNGFTFDHVFNIGDKNNRYISFQKFVDGVEIEVKIRDKKHQNQYCASMTV